MELKPETGWKILRRLSDTGEVDYCGTYGEPDYTLDPGQVGVALANWWNIGNYSGKELVFGGKYPRIAEALSHLFQLEWNDEWMIDYETDKCYRTQGDSYGWQASVVVGDGDWLTPDNDISDWIEWAVNDPRLCIPSVVWSADDLIGQGFTRWPDDETEFANGWYPGQDDDPRAITDRILKHFVDVEIVFHLTDVGQFDLHFTAYYRVDNSEEV